MSQSNSTSSSTSSSNSTEDEVEIDNEDKEKTIGLLKSFIELNGQSLGLKVIKHSIDSKKKSEEKSLEKQDNKNE